MNDIPVGEDLLALNVLPYDMDTLDGNNIGEPARRSVRKCENTVRPLKYTNHICCVSHPF